MIPAAEALSLPTAQLTPEEIAAADSLESEIERHVKDSMQRRGIEIKTTEIRNNVIAEVNQRLKRAGYIPQWQPLIEQHKLNTAIRSLVGFQISLAPSDEAYREAQRSVEN